MIYIFCFTSKVQQMCKSEKSDEKSAKGRLKSMENVKYR